MTEMTERGAVSGRWAMLGAIASVLCACSSGSQGQGQGPGDADDAPASPVDAAPDAPPAPRLIAPLSMATVTQQRPLLRWDMPAGVEAPIVELCPDRACSVPLPIIVELAIGGVTAAPQVALPPGWVYWRVRATSSGQPVTSATWQFWVGRSSASNPVDTGNGVILDVNGDGYADVLVSAPKAFSESGVVYLYLGSAGGSADWNGAHPSARITLGGSGARDGFGRSLASAGDINGDGYADFVITGGGVRLYLGSPNPSAADWNGVDARRRIDLIAPSVGGLGEPTGAGDINGDGYADLVMSGAGLARVLLGSANPSASDWSSAGSPRRVDLASPTPDGGFGGVVAGAGDVNGDGYADVLVGEGIGNFIFDARRAYLYLGSPAPSAADWSQASSPRRLEVTTADGFGAGFGTTLAGIGDVNGDGYADFAIGAELYNGGNSFVELGAAHVYLGSANPVETRWNGAAAIQRIDLVSPDGSRGGFGAVLAGTGDVNGDGFADFVVGNPTIGQGRGAAHVYLGAAVIDPGAWNSAITHVSRIDLFNPDGAGAGFGGSAAGAGDVNGDGLADFLVGTLANQYAVTDFAGAAHLYLGVASPTLAGWNGVVPPLRVDVANPAGSDAAFGNAVATGRPIRAPSRRSHAARHHRSETPSRHRG